MATSQAISHTELNPPLPDFVFPARGPTSPSLSAPSSFSRATGRRPLSSVDNSSNNGMASSMDSRRGSTPAALPVFSFNPSASSPINSESGMASPPLSPQPRNIPGRPNSFHKRGTSEFIGGAGVNLISSSPTRSENMSPSKSPPPFGPPAGRRGHAHKRSTAMGSMSDMSFILKPSDPNAIRGGSAPCSPNRDEVQVSPFPFPQMAPKETSSTEPESPPSKASRARVGFSDTVQFIPRPLSLVSSDSGTTIRAGGHSVSGSLSSVISAPSPPAKDQFQSSLRTDVRPKTAAARLDGNGPASPTLPRPIPRRHRSNPLLTDTIDPAPASPSTPKFSTKKWSFFGPGEGSPHSRPTSAASMKETRSKASTPSSPPILPEDTPIPSTEAALPRRSSITRKPNKKQKKVKSWAGSILTRKARQRTQKQQNRRSPTPPNRSSYGSGQDEAVFEFKEPEPDIPEGEPIQRPQLNTDISSWVPRRILDDDSTMSPMIDLDAALGPFNTPSGRDAEWDAVIGSGPVKRGKRMHSAAGMANFGGPGMHYHRRAASSPELENPRFGMRHLTSSSTMADVFEEDEEDAWEDAKTSDKDFSGKTDDEEEYGIDIKVVDADDMDDEKLMDWTSNESKRGLKRKGSGLSEDDRRHLNSSMKSVCSNSSLKDEQVPEEPRNTVEIFDDSYSMRPESRAQSSDSTATPPFRPRQPPKDLAPVDIHPFSLQPPYLTPTSPQSIGQSSLPSPRSPFSYDTQRISTAPSSLHDECTFQSLLMGEPGPELRMSVDDVPSLTSSNSTMTRDSGALPPAHQFRDGQRSASFSAAATRKRSSMASLSRLISSSHGEKSKLSMELRAPSITESEKKDKGSKTKRISRMMQFWKPKESS